MRQKRNNTVSVVFDRKKTCATKGFGKVELLILLVTKQKKYISIKSCNELEWQYYQHSSELKQKVKFYTEIVERMDSLGVDMTLESLNSFLGIEDKGKKEEAERQKKLMKSEKGFIDFMREELAKENVTEGTRRHKNCAIDAIEEFGRLSRFSDLTPRNVKDFDTEIRKVVTIKGNVRTDTTVYTYHKVLKQYSRLAYQYDLILKNPYEHPMCHFKKGTNADRIPLNEEELKMLIGKSFVCKRQETARDLFIFSAYTGLAYIDAQSFNFENDAVLMGGTYYIDGAREDRTVVLHSNPSTCHGCSEEIRL